MLKSLLSPYCMQCKDGCQEVAEEPQQNAAKRFLFRLRCPSSTIVVMCGRCRLSGTEEVAGVI
jgi:hypothetical protein